MHRETHLLDWATAIAGAGPTWLEIVASHMELLAVSDTRKDADPTHTDEPRKWMKRIRPEQVR